MRRRLNQTILLYVGGLIVFTSLIILVNVWISTTEHARNQLRNDLSVGQAITQRILQNREQQLATSAQVLTDDWGFKQAVVQALRDKQTMRSVLLNFGRRINVDMMAVIDVNGTMVFDRDNIPATFSQQAASMAQQALFGGTQTQILHSDGKIYQVFLLPVKAPNPIAVAMLGFEIGLPLLRELSTISQLDVSITLTHNQLTQRLLSTLPADNHVAQHEPDQLNWINIALFNQQVFAAQSALLSQHDQQRIELQLSENVQQLFAGFSRLQLQISIIALLCVLLAVLITAIIARRVTRPIRNLVNQSSHIAHGNYRHLSETDGSLEVNELTHAFNTMQDNIQNREAQIRFQAEHDLLTGLHNRNALSEHITGMFDQQLAFQAIGIKLRGFRNINDVFGHQNADLCLTILAQRLAQQTAYCARTAGGEFVLISPRGFSDEQLGALLHDLQAPVLLGNVEYRPAIALGYLDCPQQADSTEQVLRRLHIVLDDPRQKDLPWVKFDAQLEQDYLRRLTIISELKLALETSPSQFAVHYQPKINTQTGQCHGAEALVRWTSPTLGFVAPDVFIGLAEQAGIIHQLTFRVLQQVIEDSHNLERAGYAICIAINLSAQDILKSTIVDQLISRVKHANLSGKHISFELTESDLVSDATTAITQLQRLRDAGFQLAIDDFGTGYSSLAYLRSMPVNTLKVDKSFVLKLDENAADRQIVQTIIQLAHSFHLDVVAEGVESWNSWELLKSWRCESLQGFYIAKPLTFRDFTHWLEQQEQP